MQGSSCIQDASEKVLDVPQRLSFMSMQEIRRTKGVSVLVSHVNCDIRVVLRGYMEIDFFGTQRGQHGRTTSECGDVMTLKKGVGQILACQNIHSTKHMTTAEGEVETDLQNSLFPMVCLLPFPFWYSDESVLYFFFVFKEFFFIIICGSVCTVCECGWHSIYVKISDNFTTSSFLLPRDASLSSDCMVRRHSLSLVAMGPTSFINIQFAFLSLQEEQL